jgi:hypothetical protein
MLNGELDDVDENGAIAKIGLERAVWLTRIEWLERWWDQLLNDEF